METCVQGRAASVPVDLLRRRFAGSILPRLAYGLLLAMVVCLGILRPQYDWDMLGYMGVIESWHASDAATIHLNVYSAVRYLPQYQDLVGNNPRMDPDSRRFRADVAKDSVHFAQQLPFYAIKPLYLVAASVLHRAGLSLPKSLLFVSITGYVFVGLMAWLWLGRYLSPWLGAVFAGLLMVSQPILLMSRCATPDSLDLAVIVLGLYLILEYSRAVAGGLLLLAAIWVRPDVVILVGLLFCSLLVLRLINLWEWIMLSVLALLSYGAIEIVAAHYSWGVLFYSSFMSNLAAPAEATIGITPSMYFGTLARNGLILAQSSSLSLAVLTGVAAMLLHRSRSYRYLTVAILVSVVVHFGLYPTAENRFYVLAMFFAPLSLVVACAARYPEHPALIAPNAPNRAASREG